MFSCFYLLQQQKNSTQFYGPIWLFFQKSEIKIAEQFFLNRIFCFLFLVQFFLEIYANCVANCVTQKITPLSFMMSRNMCKYVKNWKMLKIYSNSLGHDKINLDLKVWNPYSCNEDSCERYKETLSALRNQKPHVNDNKYFLE